MTITVLGQPQCTTGGQCVAAMRRMAQAPVPAVFALSPFSLLRRHSAISDQPTQAVSSISTSIAGSINPATMTIVATGRIWPRTVK